MGNLQKVKKKKKHWRMQVEDEPVEVKTIDR